VDLTEKYNEHGNHMEMKLVQIVEDGLNELCPRSISAAAKKEARKCAGAESNCLTDILRKME
jgi:hypothetical protein